MDDRVRDRLMELVKSGMRSTKVLRQSIEDFVKNDIFKGEIPPEASRRR